MIRKEIDNALREIGISQPKLVDTLTQQVLAAQADALERALAGVDKAALATLAKVIEPGHACAELAKLIAGKGTQQQAD